MKAVFDVVPTLALQRIVMCPFVCLQRQESQGLQPGSTAAWVEDSGHPTICGQHTQAALLLSPTLPLQQCNYNLNQSKYSTVFLSIVSAVENNGYLQFNFQSADFRANVYFLREMLHLE